jgi:RimJ/RimL family protein N-acetyltransferase/diadenosine tetraphosphate (Ap4A) HIT family hydrolase
MSDTCTFCKILRSELPASFVYQDNDISAFLDIHPINRGHILIIPNSHYEFFEQIPSQVFAKMTNTAQEIQRAFAKAGIKAEGSNVFLSNGEIAGQEVPHAHLHITPRYRGDGHRMGFSGTDPDPAARAELNQISKSISSALKQMDWMPPLLEGARILLRPIVEEDVEAIFEYCGDPEVSKFSTWQTHKTIQDSMALVKYARANYKRGNSEPYGIVLKTNPKKVIGTVGWFWNTQQHRSIEIAYALARPLWGKGLIVEAVKSLVNEALKTNDIHRISSRCISENKASQRVMEKLGMQFEGTLRQSMFIKGRFFDMTHLSMTKEEWESKHATS